MDGMLIVVLGYSANRQMHSRQEQCPMNVREPSSAVDRTPQW
jgi:hypothetical protein